MARIVSTKTHLAGRTNELVGKAKQAVGRMTGSRHLKAEGVRQEVRGEHQISASYSRDRRSSKKGTAKAASKK